MSVEQIKRLYSQIPPMKCKEGCTGCCGPVPFSQSEWDRIADKRTATSLDCPYIENGRCAIYDNRPFICRLFGATEHPSLACPHGCKPDNPLSREQCDRLTAEYKQIMLAEDYASQHKEEENV
jgi:hypothetical protein